MDLIRRQAVIDAADKIIERDTSGNNDVVKVMTAWKIYVEALPSAQPEVIRCKDCKWHKWHKDQSSSEWLPCMEIITPPDFYCGRAERRTDETD